MTDDKSPTAIIIDFAEAVKRSSEADLEFALKTMRDLTAVLEERLDATRASESALDPDQLSEISTLLETSKSMQAKVADVATAQDAGDFDAMLALSREITDMAGIPLYEEVNYDLPYGTLKEAIEEGDKIGLRRVLMNRAPDLNVRLGNLGMSPLLDAMHAEGRSVEMVALLLDHGADPNFATEDGYTALHALCDYTYRYEYDPHVDAELAKLLVARGGKLEARDGYKLTPLLRAINCGVVAEVAALLEAGADPNAVSPSDSLPECNAGRTALMAAASDPEVVELLLEHGADITATDAIGHDVFEVIDDLLVEETEDGYGPFYDGLRASRELLIKAKH